MRTKEINVGFMFTKNLGNYESLKVDAGVVMTVEPGDDPTEVYQKAWEVARNQVKKGLQTAQGGNF